MKVTLKTETQLNISMDKLFDECIDRLDWQQRRAEQGRLRGGLEYENLEELANDSLEFLYGESPRDYDNGQEVLEVVAKNLLLHCTENGLEVEHERLVNCI